jgi:hypothetical protein
MKHDFKFHFFLTFALTLIAGTYLVFKSFHPTGIFSAFYILSLYLLKKTGQKESFFVSTEKNRFETPVMEVMIQGELLPSIDQEDKREELFLKHFDINRIAHRKLFTFLFCGLSYYFIFYKGNVPLGLDTIIPVICGLFIIKSVYIGHLLVPLAFNIFFVITHYDHNIPFAYYGVYTFFVFLVLRFMSDSIGYQFNLGKTYLLIPMTLLFLGSTYGMTFFFSNKSNLDQTDPVKKALSQARAQSQRISQELQRLPQDNSSENLRTKITQQEENIEKLEKILSSKRLNKTNTEQVKIILASVLQDGDEIKKESEAYKNGLLKRRSRSEELERFQEKHDINLDKKMSDLRTEITNNQEKIIQLQNARSDKDTLRNEKQNFQDDLIKKKLIFSKELENLSTMQSQSEQELSSLIKGKSDELDRLKKLGSHKESIQSYEELIESLQKLSQNKTPTADDVSQIVERTKKIKTTPFDENKISQTLKNFQNQHSESKQKEIFQLNEAIKLNQEELSKLKEQTKGSDEPRESLADLREKGANLKKEYESLKEMSSQEKEELSKLIAQSRKDLEVLKEVSNQKEEIHEQEKNLDKLEKLSSIPDKSIEEMKQMAEGLKKTNKIENLKEEAKGHKNNDEKSLKESHLNALKSIEDKSSFSLRRLIPIGVLIIIIIIINFYMKKNGIKKVRVMNPSELEDISNELKQLKKRKLSPREEVIYYYNLFHNILQKVQYLTRETPPSCIVYEEMLDINPKLDQATYEVTEVFTKCFYGNKEVNASSLKTFRSGISTILKVYEIK